MAYEHTLVFVRTVLCLLAISTTIVLSLIPVYLPTKGITVRSKRATAVSKVIVDNDWFGSASFIPVLLLLDAKVEVLGLTVVVGNSWVDHTTMHVLRFLELGNLNISVYKGATYPLLNTPFRTETWERMHGMLSYKGAFTPQNSTAETLGFDPTGGDPTRIVPSALPEGLPTRTAQEMSAVNFLIEQVHTYPRQVSILALGPLTNVALALKLNSTFASNVKEIIIQGGYIDTNLAQAVGSDFQANLNSDFNILFDPEASSIVLTANFPAIIMVGRAAQLATYESSYIDTITTKVTPLSTLIAQYYPRYLPMWDEASAAILLYPDLVTNAVSAFADVDIAFSSPFYGQTHLWQKSLAPAYVRSASFILAINYTRFFDLVRQAVQKY